MLMCQSNGIFSWVFFLNSENIFKGMCSLATATVIYGIAPFHKTDPRFKKQNHPQHFHETFSFLQLERSISRRNIKEYRQ